MHDRIGFREQQIDLLDREACTQIEIEFALMSGCGPGHLKRKPLRRWLDRSRDSLYIVDYRTAWNAVPAQA